MVTPQRRFLLLLSTCICISKSLLIERGKEKKRGAPTFVRVDGENLVVPVSKPSPNFKGKALEMSLPKCA